MIRDLYKMVKLSFQPINISSPVKRQRKTGIANDLIIKPKTKIHTPPDKDTFVGYLHKNK